MNFIINKSGEVINCLGISHDLLIEQECGCSILKFMRDGGVRAKVFRELMAIEYRGKLNAEQLKAINKRLRQVEIYCLITDSGLTYQETKSFSRPIRRLK